MLHSRSDLGAMALLGGFLLAVAPLGAQAEEERPRVERIRFEGVDALETGELRRSIVTEETRCRSVLLRPFCWLTDWDLFVRKEYLDRSEAARDELRLEVRYFQRGYRETAVSREIRPRGRGVEVVFQVEEGPPTLIARSDVVQAEEVLSDRQVRWARVPREGQPLDLIRLDSAKVDLRQSVENEGHLDGEVADSIAVDRSAHRAELTVLVRPGPRSTVAAFDIEGNEGISDGVIRRGLVLREGRVVRRRDLVAAERTLNESNLFHSATVEVPPQADSAKRLEIRVREAQPRTARLGGGFNSLEFVQLEGRYADFNWLGGGRRLDTRLALGNLLASQLNDRGIFRDVLPEVTALEDERVFLRPTWQASVDLQQPGFRAAENAIGVGLFAHRLHVTGVAVDRGYGGDASFTRRLAERSPTSVSYRLEVTQVEAGDLYFCVNYGLCDAPSIEAVRQPRRMSPLALSFVTNRADNPLDPVRGWRTRVDLEHASDLTWSEFHHHRASGAWAHYFPFRLGREVLAVRIRGGWVRPLGGTARGLDLDQEAGEILHPRKRFYAGGATSVRGYGENQLGPRILTVSPEALTNPVLENRCRSDQVEAGTCDPNVAPADAFVPRALGGTSVLEGNVEYRFPVWRGLSGAVFLDGALLGSRESELGGRGVWAVTPGVGARYATALGPVRVDLGYRPRTVEQLRVVTEVLDEEGVPQIVLLETPRRWDPLEGRTTFLSQVLGSLRLHVSIGQAF
jgi:outer membrane protein insertion porin family